MFDGGDSGDERGGDRGTITPRRHIRSRVTNPSRKSRISNRVE
jgi:hypothetical protein